MSKAAVSTQKSENRIVRYLRQTRAEVEKVTWPSRDQAMRLTAIVLVVTIFMAILLGTLDWIFTQLVGFVI